MVVLDIYKFLFVPGCSCFILVVFLLFSFLHGLSFLFLVILGCSLYSWLILVIIGDSFLFLVFLGCSLLFLVFHNFLVVLGCSR